jgi:hypothetical protein
VKEEGPQGPSEKVYNYQKDDNLSVHKGPFPWCETPLPSRWRRRQVLGEEGRYKGRVVLGVRMQEHVK